MIHITLFNRTTSQIKAGKAKGQSQEEVLRSLCGTATEVGHANGAVASFALGVEDGSQVCVCVCVRYRGCCFALVSLMFNLTVELKDWP
jgi:hypothetical protein